MPDYVTEIIGRRRVGEEKEVTGAALIFHVYGIEVARTYLYTGRHRRIALGWRTLARHVFRNGRVIGERGNIGGDRGE